MSEPYEVKLLHTGALWVLLVEGADFIQQQKFLSMKRYCAGEKGKASLMSEVFIHLGNDFFQ